MNISDISHISHISGVFQANLGFNSSRSKISNLCQEYLGNIPDISLAYIRHFSDISPRYFSYILSTHQANFRHDTDVSQSQAYPRYI